MRRHLSTLTRLCRRTCFSMAASRARRCQSRCKERKVWQLASQTSSRESNLRWCLRLYFSRHWRMWFPKPPFSATTCLSSSSKSLPRSQPWWCNQTWATTIALSVRQDSSVLRSNRISMEAFKAFLERMEHSDLEWNQLERKFLRQVRVPIVTLRKVEP